MANGSLQVQIPVPPLDFLYLFSLQFDPIREYIFKIIVFLEGDVNGIIFCLFHLNGRQPKGRKVDIRLGN